MPGQTDEGHQREATREVIAVLLEALPILFVNELFTVELNGWIGRLNRAEAELDAMRVVGED